MDLDIDQGIAERILRTDNSFVAILSLDAYYKGRVKDVVSLDRLKSNIKTDSLYNGNWIFVYEAAYNDWFTNAKEVVEEDSVFSQLLKYGVNFYDSTNIGEDWKDTNVNDY
ncbi:hypothetical protein [Halobacillus seohaensis]|uniref:Uncharacterized protein n=1 Tax=Halobacillus seohaensis TaxID=447421 RepID=A0ABW2EQC8_9BACI